MVMYVNTDLTIAIFGAECRHLCAAGHLLVLSNTHFLKPVLLRGELHKDSTLFENTDCWYFIFIKYSTMQSWNSSVALAM